MPIVKTLPKTEKFEIKDHRDNTAKDLIKTYSLKQLSFMDWVDTRTIKSSGKYLPVRVDNSKSFYNYKIWITKKPYSIMWIRLDEVKFMFSKRNKWKKLTVG